MNETDILSESYQYFSNLWTESKPLAILFQTESKGYIYDTGTNRILACSDHEYSLLQNLMAMDIREGLRKTQASWPMDEFLRALNGVTAAIEGKNILKTKKATQFGLSAHYGDLEGFITGHLHMIILELTERCNLRCGYCIYGPQFTQKRNHGTKDMSPETAFRAIDLLGRNSRYKKDIGLTFYGGEPLLRFPFLQACVDHARHTLSEKELSFSMTTNATLLTPQMAEFLANEGFGVHVSLDGPEDIHDRHRKDANGTGSFKRTTSGLRILFDAYRDQKQKISLSMVYSPPFSEEKISQIARLWDECPWIPKDIAISFSYAQGTLPSKENLEHRQWDYSLIEWVTKSFVETYKNCVKAHPIASQFIERKLTGLVQRPILTAPDGKYHLNGCCIPAERKLFVSVDGTLFLCERIGIAPEIGTVHTGVDIERVRGIYVKEYEEKSLPKCSECWALRLCDICYVQAYYDGRFDIDLKSGYCWAQRQIALACLKLYCSLLEINEFGLDYLKDSVIR
jgi:uncharacterized protein